MEHVQGEKNIVPDALSKLEVSELLVLPDLKQWSLDQAVDLEIQKVLSDSINSSLQLQPRSISEGTIHIDISTGNMRMYVPLIHCRLVFSALHGQAHGARKATTRIIKSRYCWPNMDREIGQWTKCCVQCQRAKVQKHTESPLIPFIPPERRFGHIHIDLVDHLPSSNGCKYLLTCVDHFTRWPEAWPLENMSAYAITVTLSTQWISRFDVPDMVTTDQGRQFQSDLFKAFVSTFGIHHIRTSPYHPQSHGMIERLHRTLKNA